MRARLRAFQATLRNHPLWLLLTILWPWIFWYLDKSYGEAIYRRLTNGAPGPLASVGSAIAKNLFLICVSLFLGWVALLFYRMWNESRPARESASVVHALQPAPVRRRIHTGGDAEVTAAPIVWADEPSISSNTSDLSSYNADAIIVSGKNTGHREVHLEDAYLVSGITGTKVRMDVNVRRTVNGGWREEPVPITSINPIPPGADIELVLYLSKENPRGLSEREFMGRWGRMSFAAQYGGTEYRKVYDEQTVARVFQRMRYGPLPPRVTKMGHDNPYEY